MKQTKNSAKSIFLLSLTALIWGSTFVAQSSGMDYVEPFTFNCIRTIIGGLVLLPFIPYFAKQYMPIQKEESKEKSKKTLLIGGLCCGIALFLGSSFQQIGIQYTSTGKAGFLTTLYIVLVPIAGLFLKKRINSLIWLSVTLSCVGLYFLCITESFSLSKGDSIVLFSAVAFTGHILVVDYFSSKVDCVKMACIQFFVCGALSGMMMLLVEEPHINQIFAARIPILYAGVLSIGVAYTLQVIGQKNINPSTASLIMSMEAVVAVLFGFILLGERLTIRELAGCILMFGAIILAQLPERRGR
jgi:Permeases of the drug/metabolite transporter (DMT) superfamily